MNRRLLLLTLLPGIAFAAVSLAGLAPTGRDLAGYFFPLRHATGEVLRGERSPYWSRESGCGEPFLANPQSAVLYPPAWLAAVLPVHRAVGVEIGFHLAMLALGTSLLARKLGASVWWSIAAGWGVGLAGPTLDSAALLANLSTMTWLPWLWWATLKSCPPGIACFLALAFLGAEPQLAATGALVALTLGPVRKVAPPLLLGGALLAVQLLPFLAWVAGSDRTLAGDAEWAAAGALDLRAVPALFFPRNELAHGAWGYVLNLTVPLWLWVLGAWGLIRGRGPVRRFSVLGAAILGLSILPGLPLGAEIWLAISRGLVRYPGRLLFLTVLLLAPAAAVLATELPARLTRGLVAGGLAWATALLFGSGVIASGIQAAALGTVMAFGSTPGALAALAASVVLAPQGLRDLEWRRDWRPPATPCLAAQKGPFRVYSVQYTRHLAEWLSEDPDARGVGLGIGYWPLMDGRWTSRSFGPLRSQELALHLSEADRGPEGRWWLDSLGAARFVSYRSVPGFPEVCWESGVVVMENPQSWPLVSVVRQVPEPGEEPEVVGAVEIVRETGSRRIWKVLAHEAGVVLWLENPDPGWRAWVDGEPSQLSRGPGIVQGVPVNAGTWEVEVRYRPVGLIPGLAFSLVALGLILGVAWRRW